MISSPTNRLSPADWVEPNMPKLTDSEIDSELSKLSGWQVENGQITKTFEFQAYADGLLFASACGLLAERSDHHPDMMITWRKVKVSLSTHSENGISDKDFALAKQIDSLT